MRISDWSSDVCSSDLFDGGSALAADGSAGMAVLVTHVSAAAGALSWTALEWRKYHKPSALGIVTGMVAGLGTITPAAGSVGPGGALLIAIGRASCRERGCPFV